MKISIKKIFWLWIGAFQLWICEILENTVIWLTESENIIDLTKIYYFNIYKYNIAISLK